MPPTVTCGSSRSTQASFLVLHAAMKFCEASFATSTSFSTVSSISKISSPPCVVKIVSFSYASWLAYFTFPCVVGISPITLTASSCNGPKRCWRILCWSLICSTSRYDCLCVEITFIRSVGGSVVTLSEAYRAFSCASRNSASTTFISGSSTKFVQICALSS